MKPSPETELHTTAWWLAVEPGAVADWRRDDLDRALVGAGRALQTVASVLLMSDPRDLGLVAQVRSPHAERPVIYLYEAVPGGVGLSPRLFERTDELLERAMDLIGRCPCAIGCPACVGPPTEDHSAKRGALALLHVVAGHLPVATRLSA